MPTGCLTVNSYELDLSCMSPLRLSASSNLELTRKVFLQTLKRARELGDFLLVGIHTDQTVR